MKIDEAVEKLETHLGDKEVFHVRHDGKEIIVSVEFIYRLKEIQNLNGVWEGFPVTTGRVSCW